MSERREELKVVSSEPFIFSEKSFEREECFEKFCGLVYHSWFGMADHSCAGGTVLVQCTCT